MTKYERLIQICNAVLFGKSDNLDTLLLVTAEELDDLCNYASGHGLLPVLASTFGRIKTDEEKNSDLAETKLEWYLTAEDIKAVSCDMRGAQQQLARLLQKDALDVMFLKGSCLAQYYSDPTWRESSDIDFYLYGHHKDGIEVLRNAEMEVWDTDDYHAHACYKGVSLELHQQFLDMGRLRTNALVEDTLASLASTEGHQSFCEWMDEDITNAYQMTPTMNAIFLMRHLANHFVAEAVTLRMLYDWGLFLKNDGKKVDWRRVCDLYEETGMSLFVRRIQQMVIDRMGMPVEHILPLLPMDGKDTERIWQSVYMPEDDSRQKYHPLVQGIRKRWEMLEEKWKYDIAFPKDPFWKMWIYMTFRGLKTSKSMLGHTKST